MTQPLAGKSALVTGGSRGIGAAIVRRLAEDGASVTFTYSTSERHAKALVSEIKTAGGVALAVRADSADTVRTLMAIGRMGKDVEIASLAAYLASPEASFITGAAITIDGGYLA